MIDILPLAPLVFLMAAIFFRIRENAVSLYQEYSLPIQEHYTWTIPLKEMQKQMERTDNQKLKTELRRSINNRKLFFLFVGLGFLVMIIVGALSS